MTDVHIKHLLSALENSATQLNLAADQANTILKTTEENLVALEIGLEFWSSAPIAKKSRTGSLGPNDLHTMGICKVGKKWCLATKPVKLVSGFYQGDMNCPFEDQFDDGDPKSIADSSREMRVIAYGYLPEFLGEYLEHVNKQSQKLNQVSQSLM